MASEANPTTYVFASNVGVQVQKNEACIGTSLPSFVGEDAMNGKLSSCKNSCISVSGHLECYPSRYCAQLSYINSDQRCNTVTLLD